MQFKTFLTEAIIKIIDGKDLYRSLSNEESDKLEARIHYLSYENAKSEILICAHQDDKIVGIAALQNATYEKHTVWLKYISVDPKYTNQGISKTLATECFNYAKTNKLNIRSSFYTEDGEKYLKHTLEALAEKFKDSVKFKDSKDHRSFDINDKKVY